MSMQAGPKPRVVAIRSTPEQTALLKAAYSVSYNPSPKRIAELSQQTGLPAKWVSNWFSRQRSKSRKNGEIIDLTTSSSASTSTFGDTMPVTKVEEDNLDVSMTDRSSSPLAPKVKVLSTTEKAKPVKAPRKRPPRTSKAKTKSKSVIKTEPQETALSVAAASSAPTQGHPPPLLPSVAASYLGQARQAPTQPPLPIPPPTRSGVASRPQINRIYPQNTTINTGHVTGAYSSTGYFPAPSHDDVRPTTTRRQNRPIMRNNFRHSVPSDYYSDPVSAGTASPYQRDLDLDSQRASSPIQSLEYSAPDFVSARPMTNSSAFASPNGPSTAQPAAPGQQSLLNLHSQALAGYTALYQNNPAVYRAMLLNYATLFPVLLPALSGVLAAPGSLPLPNTTTTLSPASANYLTGGNASPEPEAPPSLSSCSPRLPPMAVDDDNLEVPLGSSDYSSLIVKQEAQETPWNSGSDYLDFSSLHYDYAPMSHLQEHLEPFRLPESSYLFGREGVVNHLLDERLAAEEPFQAAMGLVLLSKLGLEW